jgi:hypothetical protein
VTPPIVLGQRHGRQDNMLAWDDSIRDLASAMDVGVIPWTAEFARIVAGYTFVLPA